MGTSRPCSPDPQPKTPDCSEICNPSPGWWEALPSPEQTPFESAADLEVARRLYALVEQLKPETARSAVHLHYYQGLSLAETAEVLSTPVSTVKYQLRAALDGLRGQLTEPDQARAAKSNL